MKLADYQRQAARTIGGGGDRGLAACALGIAGEAGEVADLFKKSLFHLHPIDVVKVQKELGDVLWYIAAIATLLDLDLAEIAAGNLAKLQARYPEGFSPEASMARVDEAARATDVDALLGEG